MLLASETEGVTNKKGASISEIIRVLRRVSVLLRNCLINTVVILRLK